MATEAAADTHSRVSVAARWSFDLAAVFAVGVIAYFARRGSLPSDGLWFDDSWVAAGAIHGHFTALMSDGSGTPGFTGILMALHSLGSGQLRDLGIPSLIAGIAGPPTLYVALRCFGYQQMIAAALSAALVIARIPALYAGRVKGYTVDLLLVILLAAALPYLANRRWGWGLAAAWVAVALVIATFSAYTLVAAAGAGIILVLHPASDRMFRLGAVAAQGVAELVFLVVSEKKSDLAGIEKVLQDKFDAHMNFTWNPIGLVRESLTHLRRVAQVYPGGSSALLTIFGLLAIAGLIAASVRGITRSESLVARYLLLLIATAFVGSFLHKFPFGPTNSVKISAGGRHNLWLVPAVAVGLAAIAHRLSAFVGRVNVLKFGFDLGALAIAVALIVVGYAPAPAAPFPGSQSATRFVESSIRPRDAVIITDTSTFSFADSATSPVRLVATPKHQVGFAPVYADPRLHVVGAWAAEPATSQKIRSWVAGAARVFVTGSGVFAGAGLHSTEYVLTILGFKRQQRFFDWNVVEIWRRPSS